MSNSKLHGNIGIRDRLRHFTLGWFTTTMPAEGVALLLRQAPHRFNGSVLGDVGGCWVIGSGLDILMV